MNDYIKVEGNSGLVRDKRSNAIISTDKRNVNAAKKRRAFIEKINTMQIHINNLEERIKRLEEQNDSN